MVDSVSDALNIRSDEIEDMPAFGTSLDTDCILGVAKAGSGIKILLNIDRVLTTREINDLADVA